MSRGRQPPPAAIIEEKVFTNAREIDQAIAKLRRRLDDVKDLNPLQVRYDDPQVKSAAQNISDTVLEIYGPRSPEYGRLQHHSIWHGSMYVGMGEDKWQAGFAAGIPHTIEALENLIRRLDERKADFGSDATARVRAAFQDLDLHPRIASVAADLYRGGHYRNAVLDAAVALVNMVKEKSRRHDLDGAPVMTTVFSKNNPILAFNDLSDRTDEDEQEGMMHLFVGVVLALRNPRAHALLDDAPEVALEYIALISLLAKRLDKARRVSP